MSVFTGARVGTPTTTIPSGVGTIIGWTTEDFDDGNWFDPLTDTQFVVPAGVTRIRVNAGCGFPSNSTGYRNVEILRTSNGDTETKGHFRTDGASTGKTILHATTGALDVVAGDVISVRITQNSGGNMVLKNDVHGSYFSIEDATEGETGVSVEDHDLLENRVTVNEDESQSQDIRIEALENAPAPAPGLTANVHDIVDLTANTPQIRATYKGAIAPQAVSGDRNLTITVEGISVDVAVAPGNNTGDEIGLAIRLQLEQSALRGVVTGGGFGTKVIVSTPSAGSDIKINGSISVTGPDAVATFGSSPEIVAGTRGPDMVVPTLPTDGSELFARLQFNFDPASIHFGKPVHYAPINSTRLGAEWLNVKFVGASSVYPHRERYSLLTIDGAQVQMNLPVGWQTV